MLWNHLGSCGPIIPSYLGKNMVDQKYFDTLWSNKCVIGRGLNQITSYKYIVLHFEAKYDEDDHKWKRNALNIENWKNQNETYKKTIYFSVT